MTPVNHVRLARVIVLLLLAVCFDLRADDDPADLQEYVAAELEDYLHDRPQSGVVIGTLSGDERRYFTFGRFDESDPPRPPDEQTLYEIGSIS